jgi:hypothetical protein
MSSLLVRVLIVGPPTFSTHNLSKESAAAGWGSHSVSTLSEAEAVLKTIRFKVVLAAEKLPDGTGYELASLIGRQAGSLFIGVSLSETCLWLPVVEKGIRTLGRRAMNPRMLETELGQLFRSVRVPETEWQSGSTADSVTGRKGDHGGEAALLSEAVRADIVASIVQDNSVSRSRAATRGMPVAMPPRRDTSATGAMGLKRLHTVPAQEASPLTGSFNKIWRG